MPPTYGASVAQQPLIPSDQPPDSLAVWVIYERPADYPDGYIVRPQYVLRGGLVRASALYRVAATLDAVRTHLPPGLVPLGRKPDDEPHIREVWV